MNKDKVKLDEELLKAKRNIEIAKKAIRDSEQHYVKKYPNYFEREEDKDEKS